MQAEQTAAVDPTRLGETVGRLSFDERRRVEAVGRSAVRRVAHDASDRPLLALCGLSRQAAGSRATARSAGFSELDRSGPCHGATRT